MNRAELTQKMDGIKMYEIQIQRPGEVDNDVYHTFGVSNADAFNRFMELSMHFDEEGGGPLVEADDDVLVFELVYTVSCSQCRNDSASQYPFGETLNEVTNLEGPFRPKI